MTHPSPAALMADITPNARAAAQFLKMLANEHRLMVLCTLMEGELSVGELNDRIPLSQSALSQHLAGLREAGLVTTRKEAKTVYYNLKDDSVTRVITVLHDIFCPN